MTRLFILKTWGYFFRNVMMADKLLSVASKTKSRKGNNPSKLAFQVEAAHSGIEDFLQVGPDICRALVLAHLYSRDSSISHQILA